MSEHKLIFKRMILTDVYIATLFQTQSDLIYYASDVSLDFDFGLKEGFFLQPQNWESMVFPILNAKGFSNLVLFLSNIFRE